MTIRQKSFGWIPDVPDVRDWPYVQEPVDFTPTVDLRSKCSPIEDQQSLGSCVSHAVVGALETLENIKVQTYVDLSKLFLYSINREMIGTLLNGDPSDGTYIRDAIKVIVHTGVPPEYVWPYNIVNYTQLPTENAYLAALPYRVASYYRLSTLEDMKNCLANGYPFIFGMRLFASFDTKAASTGDIDMPQPGEAETAGHAMLAVGYSDSTQRFLVRNSWGIIGDREGYLTIPYDYFSDSSLTWDLWTIRQYVEPVNPEPDGGTNPETGGPIIAPLQISLVPEPGYYTSEQLVYFFKNKSGTLMYSLNGGAYQIYENPFVLSQSTDIKYYYRDENSVDGPIITTFYTIDLNPLVITPSPFPGEYTQATVTLSMNKPGKIFYFIGARPTREYTEPIVLTESCNISYYGVSENITYKVRTIAYIINPEATLVNIYPPAREVINKPTFMVTLQKADPIQ